MDKEIQWALEFRNLYVSKNIENAREYLIDFLDLLIYLHEVLIEEKVQIEQNEIMSEQLVMKFYLHGLSICKISESYILSSKYFKETDFSKVKFIDMSSLMTVGRAQLETLLMYQHLYMNSENKDELKLRYFSWIYTALLQRQKTPATKPETIAQKEKGALEIIKLREQMESLDSFKNLSEKQQKSLVKDGSVKLFKHWQAIFDESGFSENEIFSKLYYILSVYSHSEGLSVIQLKTTST